MSPGSWCTLLGYLTGALVLWLAGRGAQWPRQHTLWLLLAGLAGGVAGAKLTQWLLLGWPFSAHTLFSITDPQQGGRTIIGGIIGGWAAVEFAKARFGIRRSTGDLFALALPAGEAVGRLGCFLNGCCYGAPCGLPWAVYQHGAWRHPAQFYALLAALAMLGALLWLRGRLWREGDLFRAYLLLYGASRFGLEFTRYRDHLYAGLSLAQWVCLELALAGGIALWVSRQRARLARPT